MSDVTVIVRTKGADVAAKEIKTIGDAGTHAAPGIEKAGRATKDLGDKATSAHGPLGGLSKAMGDIGKIAAGFVIGAGLMKLPGLFSGMISSASDVNESLSKVQVVFGDSSKAIEDFAKSASTNLGMTRGAALEAAGTFGNLFVAMGLGAPAAADMSKNVLTLATDLGSFNNLGTDEVLEKLRAGLVGEAEPLRSLGVNMNAAAVEAKGLAMKLPMVNGELTEASKIQARYAIIMDQTKTAQGDFARTSGGLANQMKILKAEVSDASAQIGTALLPMVVAVANKFTEVLPTLIEFGSTIGGAVLEAIKGLADALAPLAALAWDGLTALAGLTWSALSDAWGVVGPLLATAAGLAWDAYTDLLRLEWKLLQAVWEVVGPILATVAGYTWDALKDLANASWGVMKDALVAVGDVLGRIPVGKLKDEASDTNNWANAWANVKGAIQPAIDVLTPFVKDMLVSLKGNLSAIGAAFKELGDALAPLQPVLKPLAEILGVVLVAALVVLVEAIKITADLWTGAFVIGIRGAALAIKAGTLVFTEMRDFIVDTMIPGIQAFMDKFGEIAGKVGEFLGEAKDKVNEVGGTIISAAVTIGKQIVEGLWDGIDQLRGWLWDKVTAWAGSIKDAAMSALKINSPSKVFHEIGEGITEGLADGLAAGMPGVITFFDGVLNKWVSQVASTFPAKMAAVTGAAASLAGVVGADGNWTALPDWAGMSTIPAAPATYSQYIGGGQTIQVPTGATSYNYGTNPDGSPKYGSTLDPNYSNPVLKRTEPAWMQGAPMTINLVVDGQVLAQVVNNQNGLAY